MKSLTSIFSVSVFLFMFSCGGGSSSSSEEISTSDTGDKSAVNVYPSEGLSIKLNSDWNGKSGPKNHSLYSYIMEGSGDIYADIEDPYSETLEEANEVIVDGLPALTVKRKFMANESKVARKWFIYNGTDLIEFTVEAPEADFDDQLAGSIIKDVKITNRGEGVVLPTNKKGKEYNKPASFPDKMAEQLADLFSDEATLSDEVMTNAGNAMVAIKAYGERNVKIELGDNAPVEILDSLVMLNGFENWNELKNVMSVSFTSLAAVIPFMSDLENMEEGSNYSMTMDVVRSSISDYNISLEDLKYTYDNWQKVTDFLNSLEKNQ
jgi:hypothetical protein